MLHRTGFVALVLAASFLVAAPPRAASASEASDAYKKAMTLQKQKRRTRDDAAREDLQKQLTELSNRLTKKLAGAKLSKGDQAYLGRVQSIAGQHDQAVATLRKAVLDPSPTKYGDTWHAYLVQALIDKGDGPAAFAELEAMQRQYSSSKQVKKMSFNVGMALRGQMEFEKSAAALQIALDARNPAALKPLVNSYLMAGLKHKAVSAAEDALAKVGDGGHRESYEVILGVAKQVGGKIPLEFDAFTGGDKPELGGSVVVMGAWNVSSTSLKYTMGLLESIRNVFGNQGVVTLGITTYYKKNPETGKIEEGMSADAERSMGLEFKQNYQGLLAYTKDRAGLQKLGVSGLPHFVVVGKDGTLLFSHTLDRTSDTDTKILRSVIEKALAK